MINFYIKVVDWSEVIKYIKKLSIDFNIIQDWWFDFKIINSTCGMEDYMVCVTMYKKECLINILEILNKSNV